MDIVLFHRHYDERHLADVKQIMERKGAPRIRAIWSELYGCWLAIEGCHRLRAAHELGLRPVIVDVSRQRQVRYQERGEQVRRSVRTLTLELTDNAASSMMLHF